MNLHGIKSPNTNITAELQYSPEQKASRTGLVLQISFQANLLTQEEEWTA